MTDIVVLGGGPAGDVAALHAALRGANVTLIEERELGGTCLNRGCIPTKALLASAQVVRTVANASSFGIDVKEAHVNFPVMMRRKEEIVLTMRRGVEQACARHNVRVVAGHGVVEGSSVAVGKERIPYDALVVCVGTAPKGFGTLDMEHERVLTSDGILRLDTIPKRLAIIGGGVIGCEFASMFATLGTEVTVIEMLPTLLGPVDDRVSTAFQQLLGKQGVSFRLGAGVSGVVPGKKDVRVELLSGDPVVADRVLVAVGRQPLTSGVGLEEAGVVIDGKGWVEVDGYLRTANPAIYAAGDCIGGLQLAHLASAEAARAVDNILGIEVRPMDRTVVPSCIYTHPEIAAVGLTEREAKDRGIAAKSTQARFAGSAKALSEGEPEGFATLVHEEATGRILGATIMGVHAVEIIHEIGVAMSDGLTVEELGDIIHAHPTVSELLMDTAQLASHLAPYLS